MFQLVIHKLSRKSGLNLCLLAGITLLSAIFACHPMLEAGAGNSLLRKGFLAQAQERNEYPAVCSRDGTYEVTAETTVQAVYDRMDAYLRKWTEYIAVNQVACQQRVWLPAAYAESDLDSKSRYLQVGVIRELEAHADIYPESHSNQRLDEIEILADVDSRMMKNSDSSVPITEETERKVNADSVETMLANQTKSAFSCFISEGTMDAAGLTIGERLTFSYITNAEGEPLTLEITGICKTRENGDNFWYEDLNRLDKQLLVSEETFDRIAADYGFENIFYRVNQLLNYTQINSQNAAAYSRYLSEFRKADADFRANFTVLLKHFLQEQKKVRMVLWVLELPCVVLLLLFLYMITGKLLDTEESEIVLLRNRGWTKGKVFRLYLLQAALLAAVGLLFGLGLSVLLCLAAASTDGFLHFAAKDVSDYRPVWQMILYGAAAGLISVLFLTVPVWRRSGKISAQQRAEAYRQERAPFWERYFLDVVLFGVSLYLLYNYNRQSSSLSQDILAGEGLDPLVFLNVSLFLFAGSLFFLRLVRYLVLLIDRLGKRRWGAAMYASFLQIGRTFYRQSLIGVFLIMTIANGIFSADMARTMNENKEARIRYEAGAPAKLSLNWRLRTAWYDGAYKWWYEEDGFDRLEELTGQGLCESVTRVLSDARTMVSAGSRLQPDCLLMGIHTKEFGETAVLAEGLSDPHWFHALNALAQDPDGVIISENLAEQLHVKVGDFLNLTRFSPLEEQGQPEIGTEQAVVRAIVDNFPGYERYQYRQAENGDVVEQEQYLVAANYAAVISSFGLTPYTLWMRPAEGVDRAQLEAFVESLGIEAEQWQFMEEAVEQGRNEALIQVTNGMFTMSFLISLTVCLAGYLIYQILSVKSREKLLCIYRAMGMTLGEVHRMLLNEQLFTTLLSILAGGGAGVAAAALFVRLTILVYLPQRHNVPIRTFLYGADLMKLFAAVLAAVVVCFVILRGIIGRMRIAGALRLGED